jgi:hypothetical protein
VLVPVNYAFVSIAQIQIAGLLDDICFECVNARAQERLGGIHSLALMLLSKVWSFWADSPTPPACQWLNECGCKGPTAVSGLQCMDTG